MLASELLGKDVVTLAESLDGHWLWSKHFSALDDDRARDVLAKAEKLVAIARGAVHLQTGAHLNITLGTLLRQVQDGRSGGTTAVPSQGLIPNRRNFEQLQRWAAVGQRDIDVAHVLRVFSRGMDWHDLYHAFEVVQARVGSTIWKDGWTTKAEVRRFTQTANSRAALGVEARHGKAKVPAPKNPMTWNEADDFVRMIVWKWVNDLGRA